MLLGGALGGAAGGMAGKTADEAAKAATGLEAKSPAGIIKSIGKEGEAGAAGEAGGRLVSSLVGRVTRGGLPHFFTGATQESDELAATTAARGGVPPIRSIAPHMGVAKWHEALSRSLVGAFNEERNLNFIRGEIKDALEEIGVHHADLNSVMAEIEDTTAASATRELGASLGSKVAEHQDLLAKTVTSAQEGANEALAKDMAEVNRLGKAKRPPGDLATDVADKIISARQDFSKASTRVFQHVDSLFGDAPIVPTRIVKRQAEELAKNLPKERFALVHELAALPDKIKPSEMQSYVTKLRELGEPEDLAAAGVTKHEWRLLKKMADSSFEDGVRGGSVDPRAVKALQGARKWYGDGIRKFEDAVFNKEIDSIKSGMPPNPSVIAKMLLKPGFDARAVELRKIVGGEVWSRVGTEYLRGLIADASKLGHLEGATLKASLSEQGGLLDIAVGRKAADATRQMADRAAALEGKIPLNTLVSGDSMLSNIERLNKAVEVQEQFLNGHFLSELARPGFMHDEALNHVVKPGQTERLKAAFDWFGEGSDAVAEVRQTFMTRLLKQSMTETQSGIKTVDPNRIFHGLRGYTKEQQELLMPAGLNDDIRMIARHARFLFPQAGSDMSAGLAAGAIKSAMPFGTIGKAVGMASGGSITGLAMSAYAYAVGWGWILSRPTTIKWIAQGLDGNTATRRAASYTMQSIFDAAALGLIPDTMGLGEHQ